MSKSAKDLLSFLFLESAQADADELNIEENLERIFEAAAEEAEGELNAKKTPLAKALASFGISDADLQLDPDGFALVTDNYQKYVDAMTVLGSADAMHRLAEMGWVVTKPGDNAMTNEPPNYRIRFLDITTTDENNRELKGGTYDTGNREEVIKKAKKFATTPMDREDDLNPVEHETAKADDKEPDVSNVFWGYGVKKGAYDHEKKKPDALAKDKSTGVGKPKEGSDPEKAIHDAIQSGDVDKLIEMTTTGSMGTVDVGMGGPKFLAGPQFKEAEGIIKKPKPYGKGTKFHTPGQWTLKQPVVKQQVKRHPKSESLDEALGANRGQCKPVDPECAAQTTEAHCPAEMSAEEFLEELPPGMEEAMLREEEDSFAAWMSANADSEMLREDYENYKHECKQSGTESPKSFRAWAHDRWRSQRE